MANRWRRPRWHGLGCLDSVREFFTEMVEGIARMHGHAAPSSTYTINSDAEPVIRDLYNFCEENKTCREYHKDVLDYLAKGSQWLGSLVVLDLVDMDAYDYAVWRRQQAGGLPAHRMEDPRGSPTDVPTCVCGEAAVTKVVKRIKKGQPKSDLGRQFYACGKKAGEGDEGCDYFQWVDEARSMGPLRVSLTDLVADGFAKRAAACRESVMRAGIGYIESMYYMAALANEISLFRATVKARGAAPDALVSGASPHSSNITASGRTMTADEMFVCKILLFSGSAPSIALADVRKTCGITPSAVTAGKWQKLVDVAVGNGWGTAVKSRQSGAHASPAEAAEDPCRTAARAMLSRDVRMYCL